MRTARPILFSTPMIRALLDGRKSMTRRIVKQQERLRMGTDVLIEGDHRPEYLNEYGSWQQWVPNAKTMRCPYGVPGDLLYVKETFAHVANFPPTVRYYATDDVHELRKKLPSIYMPRWASRLTLELTDVRVERLQDISEQDAIAEGADRLVMDDDGKFYESANGTHRCGYAGLWDHINGDGSWDENPFVWCISFRTILANIDSYLKERAA